MVRDRAVAKGLLAHLGLCSGLGFEIAASVGGGAVLGHWLDSRYRSSPVFLMIGLVLGSAMAVFVMVRLVKLYNRLQGH